MRELFKLHFLPLVFRQGTVSHKTHDPHDFCDPLYIFSLHDEWDLHLIGALCLASSYATLDCHQAWCRFKPGGTTEKRYTQQNHHGDR